MWSIILNEEPKEIAKSLKYFEKKVEGKKHKMEA